MPSPGVALDLDDMLKCTEPTAAIHQTLSVFNALSPRLQLAPGSSARSGGSPNEQEMQTIRARALEIRNYLVSGKGKGRADGIEMELVDMVLRLTAARPARTQVLGQADTVRILMQQQEMLITRLRDEENRAEAEKESLQRISEALVAQANLAFHGWYNDVVRVRSS